MKATAQALLSPGDRSLVKPAANAAAGFSRKLARIRVGDEIPLPDGRRALLSRVQDLPTRTRHEIKSFVLTSNDGQTLHVTKRRRIDRQTIASNADTKQHSPDGKAPPHERPRVAFAIETANLERSSYFYRELVGLEVTRETEDFVSFEGDIVLFSSSRDDHSPPRQLRFLVDHAPSTPTRMLIFVKRPELEALHKRMLAANVAVSPVTTMRSFRRFRCADPDGTIVEIREASGSAR